VISYETFFDHPVNGYALKRAALKAFEGRYEAEEIGEMVEQAQILETAMLLILSKA